VNFQVQWDNSEKTIILQTFSPCWEWQDLHLAREESRRLLDSVSHKVHFISDMQKTIRVPGNYFEQMSKLVEDVHPNVGLSVTVTPNPLIKEMFYIFSAMKGGIDFEYRFVRTMDEARDLLRDWIGFQRQL
jgi:hypothetical protein